jgi:hypothetical protein
MFQFLAQPNELVPPVQTVSVQDWTASIVTPLSEMGRQLLLFIPNLLAALVVFFVGWAVAVAAGRLVERLFVALRINPAFEHFQGLKDAVERAGLKLNVSLVVGEIVKWFLIIVTLLAATDILGLTAISGFLVDVLRYIPNVVVAALILIIAVVLANFVYRTVAASITAAGFGSATIIAAISKWSIIVFAVMAALTQLRVAVSLIQTITTAFFAMIAIAGGLAFGLGGKEVAAKWLSKLESDLTGHSKL